MWSVFDDISWLNEWHIEWIFTNVSARLATIYSSNKLIKPSHFYEWQIKKKNVNNNTEIAILNGK